MLGSAKSRQYIQESRSYLKMKWKPCKGQKIESGRENYNTADSRSDQKKKCRNLFHNQSAAEKNLT